VKSTLVIKARNFNGEIKCELFAFQSENFIPPTGGFIALKHVIRAIIHFLEINFYLK